MVAMEGEKSSLSYYKILGVGVDSSSEEIRRAYRRLAMQWHPDRWTRTPSLLGEAKRRFQQIQEAYAVLSDHKKRTLYDTGLFDPQDEEDEGFCDFVEEMMSLVAQTRRAEKNYSMEELQTMFLELAQQFDDDMPCEFFGSIENSISSHGIHWDRNPMANQHQHLGLSGFGMYRTSSSCS